MKVIVINKKPFGVTEFDNVISVGSGNAASPIIDSVVIRYIVNDSAVERTFSTGEVLVQIM